MKKILLILSLICCSLPQTTSPSEMTPEKKRSWAPLQQQARVERNAAHMDATHLLVLFGGYLTVHGMIGLIGLSANALYHYHNSTK